MKEDFKTRRQSPVLNFNALELEKKSDKKPIVISLNQNLKSILQGWSDTSNSSQL